MSTDLASAVIRIHAGRRTVREEAAELRSATGLLYFLVWRDLKVRYRQTALGVAWAVIQPLGLALIFAVFLGRLAKVPSDGQPYALFALAGMTIWSMFSSGLEFASVSLVNNANLVTKTYFPRVVLPLAGVVGFVPDLALGSVVLLSYALATGAPLRVEMLLVPLILVWCIVLTAGFGIYLSSVTVRYRDVRYAMRLLMQMWLFMTPVAYSWTLVPESWRGLYGVNPMAGVVALFRWASIGGPLPSWSIMWGAIAGVLIVPGLAIWAFRRADSAFADII